MDMSNGETSNATIGIIKTITRTIETEQRGLSAMQAALPEGLGDAFAYAAELIELSGGAVVVTGMGKSGLIGRKIAATLASTGTPSHFVHPGEASHGDLGMIGPRDVVLALSWSARRRSSPISSLIHGASITSSLPSPPGPIARWAAPPMSGCFCR